MNPENMDETKENLQSENENAHQSEERELLKRLREEAFGGKDEQLAIALGRPLQEVRAWFNGEEKIDEDVIVKAHGLLQERAF